MRWVNSDQICVMQIDKKNYLFIKRADWHEFDSNSYIYNPNPQKAYWVYVVLANGIKLCHLQ